MSEPLAFAGLGQTFGARRAFIRIVMDVREVGGTFLAGLGKAVDVFTSNVSRVRLGVSPSGLTMWTLGCKLPWIPYR